ncbi:WG repeat-containing protein [Anaerocolumna sp. AGMB13025]|uniref:WG repeat-containing protein n=1 Tax=Anaerocolumna sp. AGMB13025 TaxID=3039116 RepID=UPI00241F3B43|nr:WG repeat-containing protein [Anaerocolumna sp. AGMB13025]WFR57720.1 WG repeat-containing protein [Anaerocolumna sp. AGMB13025]
MKRYETYIRRAILLSGIILAGYAGSRNTSDVAYASNTAVNLNGVKVENVGVLPAQKVVDTNALYPISVQTEEGIKYGYIDATGKTVIKPIYDNAENFSEGFAVIYNGNKSQVINQKGEVIFECSGAIQNFHDGLAAYMDTKADYKQGYINTKGKVVIKPQFTFAGDFKADHTAMAAKGNKFYKIDKKGKILKTYQLDKKYESFNIADDGYIIVNDPKTYLQGVISLSGKVILKPVYGEVTYLGNNLFGVKKKVADDEGYLLSLKPAAIFNSEGKKLTSYQYYDLSQFNGEYASATDDNYTYFIDKNGKKVTTLPKVFGRGNMEVLGDVVKANIYNEFTYMKKDGTIIWKKADTTVLADGISVNTLNLRPNKYVIVNYPEVDGIRDASVEKAINKKLKSLFTDSRKNLKASDNLSVEDTYTASLIKDVLIINQTGYDYPVGAAHGTPLNFYYFINVKTGEFYQLKDLFKSNSSYAKKLETIIAKQMKANTKSGMVYFADSKGLIGKDQFFYISKDSLMIYFDPGAIAAYAAGFPKFEIPFKDINSIINTEGSFWKAFH